MIVEPEFELIVVNPTKVVTQLLINFPAIFLAPAKGALELVINVPNLLPAPTKVDLDQLIDFLSFLQATKVVSYLPIEFPAFLPCLVAL